MLLKLDIRKACAELHWNFVKNVLKTMNNSDHWANMIMQYVSIVSYSILVNIMKAQKGGLVCQREFIRSDPLSPQLFILYVEALSS